MKLENLRSLIRESIAEYVKEIDEAAETAAHEARVRTCEEAIAAREAKLTAISESDHKDLMDEGKIKGLENEIKELKKAKAKFEKTAEKRASKKAKKSAPKEEDVVTDTEIDEAPVGAEDVMAEMDLEEAKKKNKSGKNTFSAKNIEPHERDNPFDKGKTKNQPMDENVINESFLKMQKLAGVITESEYNKKKSLIKEILSVTDYQDYDEEKDNAPKSDEEINNMDLSAAKRLYQRTNNNINFHKRPSKAGLSSPSDMSQKQELMKKLEAKIRKEDPNYFKTKK
jgi:hypothetical protein